MRGLALTLIVFAVGPGTYCQGTWAINRGDEKGHVGGAPAVPDFLEVLVGIVARSPTRIGVATNSLGPLIKSRYFQRSPKASPRGIASAL